MQVENIADDEPSRVQILVDMKHMYTNRVIGIEISSNPQSN